MDQSSAWGLDLGATLVGPSRTRFRVWVPHAKSVAVRLRNAQGEPLGGEPVYLAARPHGYFEAEISGVTAGMRYTYLLDGAKERPDPASRWQPDGVHGPSAVVNPKDFAWTDGQWRGLPLERLIFYEMHTGTFTQAGTFEAIISHLAYLREEVGITAIELMPVGQFPGARNWGYDGVYLYAPQSTYGGPQGLKTLVDACHAGGLAVILDVVYNHLGPEGNYLGDFGPYFTDHYRTPWGPAINYDGPDSDEVRHFVIANALYWLTEYHLDGLRLDAIHGIYDFSAKHLLAELAEAVHRIARQEGRVLHVIAESNLNDPRVIEPAAVGGFGLDAQWNDDFHHALHTALTGERDGYYQDFSGVEHLAAAWREGFVYAGQRSLFRRRRHGRSSRHCEGSQFVVFAQNHDQVGNRALGERLSALVSLEALKVATASVLLSPCLPLLFMGEEYGETTPFLYFTNHGDPGLAEAVRRGRREEFAAFGAFVAHAEVPDPQDPATFERSRIHPGVPADPRRAAMLRWHQGLIALRKAVPALGSGRSGRHGCRVWAYEAESVIVVHRWVKGERDALILLGFNREPAVLTLNEPAGQWRLGLDGVAEEFGGTGEGAAPPCLIIGPEGVSVRVGACVACVYLRTNGTAA